MNQLQVCKLFQLEDGRCFGSDANLTLLETCVPTAQTALAYSRSFLYLRNTTFTLFGGSFPLFPTSFLVCLLSFSFSIHLPFLCASALTSRPLPLYMFSLALLSPLAPHTRTHIQYILARSLTVSLNRSSRGRH